MRTKPDALHSSSARNCSGLAITFLIVALAATLILISLTNSGQVAAQTGGTPTPGPAPDQPINPSDSSDQDLPPIEDKLDPPQYPNMDSNLNRIVERVQSGQFTAQAAAADAPVHSGASVAVTLYITEGYADAIAAYLTGNGASPRNIGVDYIEAYVPVSLLADASLQEGVISIRTIIPPQPAQGAVVSEGFWVHGVSSWRRAGYRGKGVKIGIIDAGFGEFDRLMGTELPSTVQARCYIEVGVFTSDLADCETGSHGTAVTEAIFDIAPEATYYISNALASGDLAKTAVDWMVEEGVDVINMSLGFSWDGRGDGTFYSSNSPLRSVEIAVANGITWANAAGNDALGTWFGSFTDSNDDGFHEFSGTDECNEIQVGGSLFQLRWDDQWGGATIDLDLYLYDLDSGVHMGPLVSSNDVQSGAAGDIPYEELEFWTDHGGTYCLAVRHHSGDTPDWIQLTGWNAELEHHTLFGSTGNPAESASPGMLAVGAAPSDDVFTIEEFSSRGPTPDGRVKPDIVGADQSDSAVWGHWEGTSQASPHVAGLAALVKQRFPDYSPAQIAEYLKDHAEERGVPGPDNTWGYGFARLPALDEDPSVFIDRATLVAFYNATNGDDWTDNTDWLTDAHIYGWYGVTVDIDGNVTRLILEDNNLEGDMPAELGDLSSLTELNLWNNRLTGEIPDELSNITKLRTLDIGRNQLDGEIPAWLGELSDLEELYLQDNRLTGNIPEELANLSDLDALFLADNQLTGCIPEGLRDIPDNDFADTGLLFCGEEPPDPCVEQLTGDGIVNGSWTTGSECVSENRDGDGTGAYARYYTFTLTAQSELTIILESTADTYLYLLEGAGRDGEQIVENDDIDRDGGDYNSSIEETLAPGDYTIEATTYEAEVSGTFTLTVTGLGDSAIPSDPSSDREVLVALFEATDGPAWNDNDNWLTDEPLEDWHGVNTDDYGRVNELFLYDNNLSGHIPSELGNLTELEESDLGKNHLSGHIPRELGNLTYLTSLLLDENELTGAIPPELGDLRELESLLLNENQLTGSIPSELGNLTELEELLLAGNQLTGCIPEGLRDIPDNDFDELGLPFCDDVQVPTDPCIERLTGDGTVNGSWETGSECVSENRDGDGTGAYARYYTFTLSEQSELTIALESTEDPYLYLMEGEGRDGKQVAENDDIDRDGGDYNSSIEETLAPGDYTIEATTYEAEVSGMFTLTVKGLGNVEIQSDREALVALYNATNGDDWDDDDNWLSSADIGKWWGVTTDDNGRVIHLDLSDNELSGTLPSEIGWLVSLKSLDFSGNELKGKIPPALGNLSSLTELILWDNQLTGEIPSELGNLTNLRALWLDDNRLTGNIPEELANLFDLDALFLADNQLTGCVPKALRDIPVNDFDELGLPFCENPDRAALVALYHATGGDNWTNNTNWLTDAPLSEWHGVKTDDDGRATRLDLEANNLSGELPLEFGNLDHLQWVNISHNQLTGELSRSLTNLTMLEHFYFDNNAGLCAPDYDAFQEWAQSLEDFRGDPCPSPLPSDERDTLIRLYYATLGDDWTNNTNWVTDAPLNEWHGVATDGDGRVTELTLDNNKLTGPIPPELSNLTYLEDLGLWGNQLIGSIPLELGKLTNLKSLGLSHNELTGPIPTELGKLTNLEDLWIEDNQLSGTIPPELGNLDDLESLVLSRNRLSGAIPPELGNLANLKFLSLRDSQLSGAIPSELGKLSNLEHLSIENNYLSGVIPQSLTKLTSLEEFRFDGLGELCAPADATFQAWLDNLDTWSGSICSDSDNPTDRQVLEALHHATGGASWRNSANWMSDKPLRAWHGVTTDKEGHVVTLRLVANYLTGVIPPELAKLSNLKKLSLWGNQLNGTVPPELGNLNNLTGLALFNNRLSGEIPPELSNLDNLTSLSLDGNQLSGEIPPTLGNLTNLEYLQLTENQLTGTIPSELGGLANLRSLSLSDNQLSGEIPSALAALTNLEVLALNKNRLTGTVLAELSAISNLRGLLLYNNQLTGTIPSELGNLTNLSELYLADNQLTGEIPSELGNLSNLNYLYLNDNRLMGEVPAGLGSINFLHELRLNDNRLTGALPQTFTQLEYMDEITFHNNAGLCAPADVAFQEWLQSVENVQGDICGSDKNSLD